MTDSTHDIALTDAAEGVPTAARCTCGWTWHQPAGDLHADTLPTAARAHLAEQVPVRRQAIRDGQAHLASGPDLL